MKDPFGMVDGFVPDMKLSREKEWKVIRDRVASEAIERMSRGVRDTAEILPDDSNRGRILGRLERDGFLARFKVGRKPMATLTPKGVSLAREIARERDILKAAMEAVARVTGKSKESDDGDVR